MELLAPAGSFEKLRYAIEYGADAVYAAGKQFGLRAKATNLDEDELAKAVKYVHERGKKIFITANIFANNQDIDEIPPYIDYLSKLGVDAVIASDPGVISIIKETAPTLPIHLSTQANTTSWKSAEFWAKQGVSRIILAREVSFAETKEMIKRVPELEYEIFVHGAMCISYSGRCLLSAFLNNRSANRGLCTHPCRWEYTLTEKSRPGEEFAISEDERGTYILNSKDLSLYDKLEEIVSSGITSLKIEGRMKSLYYVANTTRVYKTAIQEYLQKRKPDPQLKEELYKISHREYTTAFFDDSELNNTQTYETSGYKRNYQFLGEVVDVESAHTASNTQLLFDNVVNIRAKFSVGEEIEVISPDHQQDVKLKVQAIYDEDGNLITDTKPNTNITLKLDTKLPRYGILRKQIK
ncbi:MAG: U32 family peptidase [Candidatus Cloacimonas sp.]|nr:U32 family peptidase [Candidatus Cloacimonadota bacterium]